MPKRFLVEIGNFEHFDASVVMFEGVGSHGKSIYY
jgi:hypothetical protein